MASFAHAWTVRATAILFSLGPLGACNRNDAAAPDIKVVATVNGETLSFQEFDRELSRDLRSPEGGGLPPAPDVIDRVRKELLERMVGEMLMLQAARQMNLSVSPEDVARRVMRIKSDYSGDGFTEALEESQLSPAEHQQKTASRLTLEKLLAEHVYPRVAVTEEEIRQDYDREPERYAEPERVRAAQIVVKNVEDAQKILGQLRSGKRFEDLAQKYSLSADSKVGGDLGFFPRGVMPPQFDEVAFRLNVGQVSEVVTTEYGFHIFKVLEKRGARKRSFGEARGKIEAQLVSQKRAEAEAEFRKSLREHAEVKVNATALALAQGNSPTLPPETKTP